MSGAFPFGRSTIGGSYLSRNYDFSIGSIADVMGLPLPPEVKAQLPPVMSEPYIMEWYPEDGGYPAKDADQAFHSIAASFQARTLWHSLYDQQAGTVEISFYLGDTILADGTRGERRSNYLRFALDQQPALAWSQPVLKLKAEVA